MAKIVKSSRGTLVDFDLLMIQNQLSATPKPTSVAVREQLIDKKLRRRTKKLIDQAAAPSESTAPQDQQDQQPEDTE